MASRAERRAICTLVMCDCLRQFLIKPSAKCLSELLMRLERAVNNGFDQWLVLEKKHIQELNAVIVDFEQKTFAGQAAGASVHTSVALGLLDELKRALKGKRREAVEEIERVMKRIHLYYDRTLNRIEDYRTAARFLQTWDQTLAKRGL